MFRLGMNPLCRIEFEKYEDRIHKLEESLAAVETKLDQLLDAKENLPERSIEGEPKPEPMALAPGHKPWSQRKRERETKAKSSTFTDKVRKGAATTKPEEKPDAS